MKKTAFRKTAFIFFLCFAVILAFTFTTDPAQAASKKKLKAKNVTLSAVSYTVKYNDNGGIVVQKPSVTVKYGGKVLTSGTNYIVTYSNQKSKNAGTYKVTVKGKGKYKGKVVKKYKIKPLELTSSDCCLRFKPKDRAYYFNGKKQGPAKSDVEAYYVINTSKGRTYVSLAGSYKVTKSLTCSKPDGWDKTGTAYADMTIKLKGNFRGTVRASLWTADKPGYVIWPSKPEISSFETSPSDGGGNAISLAWTPAKGDFDFYYLTVQSAVGRVYAAEAIEKDQSENEFTFTDIPAGKYYVGVSIGYYDESLGICPANDEDMKTVVFPLELPIDASDAGQALGDYAASLCWPYGEMSRGRYAGGAMTDAYREAYEALQPNIESDITSPQWHAGASCDLFVATAVRGLGLATFPVTLARQCKYFFLTDDYKDHFVKVETGGDPSMMQHGDICILIKKKSRNNGQGHIFIVNKSEDQNWRSNAHFSQGGGYYGVTDKMDPKYIPSDYKFFGVFRLK